MEMLGIIISGKLLLICGLIIWVLIRTIIFTKTKKLILKKEILYTVFVIYILSLIGVTLLPIFIYFTPLDCGYGIEPSINLDVFNFIKSYSNTSKLIFLENTIGNLLLLSPLGILLPLIWNKKFKSFKKITIMGIIISFTIEISQYFEIFLGLTRGYRVCDITDLVFNTISIILGYMIFKSLFDDEKFIISNKNTKTL